MTPPARAVADNVRRLRDERDRLALIAGVQWTEIKAAIRRFQETEERLATIQAEIDDYHELRGVIQRAEQPTRKEHPR